MLCKSYDGKRRNFNHSFSLLQNPTIDKNPKTIPALNIFLIIFEPIQTQCDSWTEKSVTFIDLSTRRLNVIQNT